MRRMKKRGMHPASGGVKRCIFPVTLHCKMHLFTKQNNYSVTIKNLPVARILRL